MINDFFMFDSSRGQVEIDDTGILLVREFATLLHNDKSKNKSKLFKQLTYIYLALSWKSPYASYSEQERHEEALSDSGLTQKEFDEPDFRAACRKYRELQDSNKSIKMLNAARSAVDQIVDYFETILDLNERDQNGKPIFAAEKVMKQVASINEVHEELVELENRIKREMTEQSQIRAGAVEGFEDTYDDD